VSSYCRRVSSAVSQPRPGWTAVLRRWRRPTRREAAYDLALWVVLAAITVLEALLADGGARDGPLGLTVTLAVAVVTAAGAVALRRSAPILTVVAVSAIGSWIGGGIALLLVTSYGVGYRVTHLGRAAAGLAFAAIVPTVIGWWFDLRHRGPEYDLGLILAIVITVMTVAALIGRYNEAGLVDRDA
jgi:hypothetical protein